MGVFINHSVSAQDIVTHEYSLSVGGGLSSLKYDDVKSGTGGNIALGYTHFFNEKWGLKSGLELSILNSKLEDYSGLAYQPGLMDSEGDQFDYYSAVSGYSEKQKATFLNIPIMGQFQIDAFSANKFYALAGFKVGIPISGNYKSEGNSFINKGWYPHLQNWAETQKFAGFGDFKNRSVDADLDLEVAFMISLETGIKWAIGDGKALYTGVFIDYGLNDVVKNHDKPFVEQRIESGNYDFANNSVLESRSATKYIHEGGELKQNVDKVIPFSIGLKIGFSVF